MNGNGVQGELFLLAHPPWRESTPHGMGGGALERSTPHGKNGCFEPDASVMFKAFRPFHEACFSSMAALDGLA
jgi:hypothetical protein